MADANPANPSNPANPANAQNDPDSDSDDSASQAHPVYTLVQGDQIVEATDALNEDAFLQQILYWIGFRNENSRENLRVQLLGSFDEMMSLTEKDVQAIATDWSSRTSNLGRFFIGTRRLKLLQALTHWIQDFRRISDTPSIVGLNESTFKAELSCALDHATIRKVLKDQSSTASEATSPGPLESKRKWKVWEEKFVNYLRT